MFPSDKHIWAWYCIWYYSIYMSDCTVIISNTHHSSYGQYRLVGGKRAAEEKHEWLVVPWKFNMQCFDAVLKWNHHPSQALPYCKKQLRLFAFLKINIVLKNNGNNCILKIDNENVPLIQELIY